MAKITSQQYEPAFDIAKTMGTVRIGRSQAIELIVKNGLSQNSVAM
ncbi:hypothetical protein P0C22_15185 [Plesiomonas shigelloides]